MNLDKVFVSPPKENLTLFAKWFPIVLGAFLVIYYSCNAYAANQLDHYHMYTDWELSIPLIPEMIFVYMSYIGVFGMVLFVLKTPSAIKGLAYSMLVTLVVSGVIFVLFPGHLGYVRPDHVAGYSFLFKFLYVIDLPHNLYPSLHVAFALLCMLAMIHQTLNSWFHIALKVWFALVCASVVLVHQHHFFDIGLAIVLAWAVYRLVYLKTAEKWVVNNSQSMREVSLEN